MKNYEILALVNGGALAITDHTVPTEHAIKVYRFKKSLRALYEKIFEDEKALIKDNELEIKDGGKLDGDPEKVKRFVELRQELYNEEATIECKTMPYEAWHTLKAENKAVKMGNREMDILAPFEVLLENVLWKEEEEV